MYARTEIAGEDLPLRRRAAIGAVLVLAIVAVAIPRLFAVLSTGTTESIARAVIADGLMVSFPLLLKWIAPKASDFDMQWLPSAWSDWAWFFGMLILLVVGGGMVGWVAGTRKAPSWLSPELYYHSYGFAHRPATIAVYGIHMILVGPIAEEVFWRGYSLEQLRKLTYGGVALLGQSFLFALSHFSFLHHGPLILVTTFWYGLVLGAWRIRFRSILPLMLAHVILNALALLPTLKPLYDHSVLIWSKPQLRQIDSLTQKPVQEAVPAIITFLANPDEDVQDYASLILITRYRADAEPYLKHALASGDTRTINGALFVVDMAGLSGLTGEVRKVAWCAKDQTSQLEATLTLDSLGDTEGLRTISEKHPNKTVRRSAEFSLNPPGTAPPSR